MVTLTPLHLKQAGFSDDSIIHWINNQRPLLKKAGFSDMEINNTYGLKVLNSDLLTSDDMDVDASLLVDQKDEVHKTDVSKLNEKNTADTEKSDVSVKEEIVEKQETINEFLKLSKEDQTIIKNKVEEAYNLFTGKDGRVGFINEFLDDFYPNLSYEDIKLSEDKDINLMHSALNEDHTSEVISNEMARDILEGKVGYDSKDKKYVFSKEFLEAQKVDELEKELKKKKLFILNTPLTTGKETRRMLQWAANYHGWNEHQVNVWNDYISYTSALESDNRNIASKDGSAWGLFQFKGDSLVTALHHLIFLNRQLDPNYKTSQWITSALSHKRGDMLTPDQQRAVTMANFLNMSRNDRLNRDGTDALIKAIANEDIDAMKKLYKDYHHADWIINVEETGEGDEYWEVRENAELDKRMKDHFKWWGTLDVGYMNPEAATIPSSWNFKEGLLGKIDNYLSFYAGGQGHENIFKQGFSDSVTGMFMRYNDWWLKNPEASDLAKDDMMKEIFMYQNQTFGKDIIQSAITLVNDMPYMIAGCFTAGGLTAATGWAAPAAPVVCMGAAFALPEVLRHSFMEGMMDGRTNDLREWIDHFIDVKTGIVGAKMFGLGTATGTTGLVTSKLVSKALGVAQKDVPVVIARLTSEIYVMTELGARMSGHAPTLRDFAHTAVLIGGFHASVVQVRNLMNIYKGWALHPKDLLMIADQRPEVMEQLKKGEIPDFIYLQQKQLLEGLEKTQEIKLLAPPKFAMNEKVSVNVGGMEEGIIISKEVIGNEAILIVKKANGETVAILESQARKLDPKPIKVEVKKDGKLELIVDDIKDVDAPATGGSKDSKTSFKEKQKNNEYGIDIVEITRENNKIINKDGTEYKSTVTQALNDTSGSGKTKVYSEDGKVSSDGHILVVNKFYPKFEKEFNKKNKKGDNVWDTRTTFKTAKELIDKVFKGLTNRYKKISIVFAGKKGERFADFDVDTLVGKIGDQFVSFSRKAYEQLITFTEGGVEKTAKLVGLKNNKPLVFIHPETNKVIAMLMPKRISKDEKIYSDAENYWEQYTDKKNTGNFHYEKNTRDGDNLSIPNEPYRHNEWTEGKEADYKRFFDNAQTLTFWDIVTLVESLLGKLPKLKSYLGKNNLGVFRHLRKIDPNKPIKEQASVEVLRNLQENPMRFLMTLTHELGHLIDFVPEHTLSRGNILGHISSLKKYLNKWIDGKNDGAKPLDQKEIKQLRKEAERLAKENESKTNEEIKKDLKITPETILKIFTDAKAREKINKIFYDAFAKLSSALKKEVVKDAMKGLMSHHMKAIADKINGIKVDPKVLEDAQRIFKDLFEAEIQNRGLVNREMIMEELKNLSIIWKPFNRATEKKSYVKYRDSPEELMADFMMAWILRPQWLKINAPKTFDLWKYHIENRPEVKDLYFEIQNKLNSSKNVVDAARAEETKRMFYNSEKKIRAEITDIGKKRKRAERNDLYDEVIDSFWWLLTTLKLDNQKGNSPLSKDLSYYIENWRYRASNLHLYKQLFEKKIMKKLLNLGYNKLDLGWTLLLINLAKSKQRTGKVTWKFFPMPEEWKAKLKAEEGDIVGTYERWAMEHPELVKIAYEFFEFRKDYVVKEVKDWPVWDNEMKAEMDANYEYITYMPVEKMLKRFRDVGTYSFVSKVVKKTLGTFSELVNPVDTTIAKDLILMATMKMDNLLYHIVQHLKLNEKQIIIDKNVVNIIHKPKYIAKGKLEPVKSGLKRVSFMRNGKIETWDIHRGTAEALLTNPLHRIYLLKSLNLANSVYRGIFTEHNPLFWAWNWAFRDMRRSIILLPWGKKWKGPYYTAKYIAYVFKNLPASFKSLYGEGTAVTRFMDKNGFLIAPEEGYRGQAGMQRSRYELSEDAFMLKKLIWDEYISKNEYEILYDGVVGKYLYHSGMVARALERSHKIAGFEVIGDQIKRGELDMTNKELMKFVQAQVGSPSFLRTGKANAILNNMLLFFNANKEGIRGDIEGFAKDPWGVAGRFFAFSLGPKILEKMIYLGLLGAGYASLYEAVPDYDRNNFNIWIIGKWNNRPVYLRFPLDQTSQMATSLWSMWFDQQFGFHKAKSQTEKMKMWWEGLTHPLPHQTPLITQIYTTLASIFGDDIKDRFGSPIFDPLIQKMDLLEEEKVKLFELMKYNWNTYGISWIHEFTAKFEDGIVTEYEHMTGFPLIDPLINRFLKVGNDPVMDIYYDHKNIENRIMTNMQYHMRTAIDKIVQGGNYEFTKQEQMAIQFTPDITNNSYFMEQLGNQIEATELLKEWMMADTKERLMILKAIKKVQQKNIGYTIGYNKE